MAFYKASARVKRSLPQSPRRRKLICRRLAEEFVEGHADYICDDSDKPLSDIDRTVIEYYERDDISRQAPGRKDSKLVNGTKIQVRHLHTSTEETYALFKKDYSDMKVGLTKFRSLRPKHVLFSSQIPHSIYYAKGLCGLYVCG